jgi:tetratricopeptide (TPR) repeat protein
MMGRYFWKQRGPSSLQKSLHYFNNALHLDRQCADAYAGISDCYVSLSFHNVIPTGYAMTRATEAALAALKLNGMSAACQCAYANVLLSFNWDFKEAEKASYRSIELDPCNPQSLTVCSMLFGIKGRNEEAVQLALSAVRHDPLSSTLNNALAAAYYQAGDYRQAIKVSNRTIELQPNLVMGHVRLGLSLAELGNCYAAEAVFNHVVSLCNRSPYSLALLAFAQAKLKKAAQARELLSEIHQPKYSECVPFVDLAAVYAALEQRSTAMECLTRAFERREMRAIFLRGDPRFRCLQEEAEFQRILSFLE